MCEFQRYYYSNCYININFYVSYVNNNNNNDDDDDGDHSNDDDDDFV